MEADLEVTGGDIPALPPEPQWHHGHEFHDEEGPDDMEEIGLRVVLKKPDDMDVRPFGFSNGFFLACASAADACSLCAVARMAVAAAAATDALAPCMGFLLLSFVIGHGSGCSSSGESLRLASLLCFAMHVCGCVSQLQQQQQQPAAQNHDGVCCVRKLGHQVPRQPLHVCGCVQWLGMVLLLGWQWQRQRQLQHARA